jgi:AAA family ATP:ADP antiporter
MAAPCPTAELPPPRSGLYSAVGLCLLAYALTVTYALARPTTESLYIEHYGGQRLPLAWLALVVGSALVATLYRRAAARFGLLRLQGLATAASATILGLCLVGVAWDLPLIHFFLYLWKDLYIIVVVEVFWSIANATYPLSSARWLYGLFLGAGALGGISGNLLVSAAASAIGTLHTLWLDVPLLLVCALACLAAARRGELGDRRSAHAPQSTLRATLETVWNSRYLSWVVLLVAVVQVAVTLVDYRYNLSLERNYAGLDERTAASGRVYMLVEVGSLSLQLLSGPVLRFAGAATALVLTPALLSSFAVANLLHPSFGTAAALKIASKCLDYSLFRASKELLYIPLSFDEQVSGKAVADVFTYRTAKGMASLLLLGLGLFAATQRLLGTQLVFLLIVLWGAVAAVVARRHRQLLATATATAPTATAAPTAGAARAAPPSP